MRFEGVDGMNESPNNAGVDMQSGAVRVPARTPTVLGPPNKVDHKGLSCRARLD